MWRVKTYIKVEKPDFGEIELVYLDKHGNDLPQRLVMPCNVLNEQAETNILNDWQVLDMVAALNDFMHNYLWENSTEPLPEH